MQKKVMNVPILMYHSIAQEASSRFHPFTVSPALFDEQMAYLRSHEYTPLTVTQFIAGRSQAALPPRPVVLTFDDGFADFAEHAFPTLRRYGFPATLYVATAYVNATSRWLAREGEATRRMVSWQQLREISRSGIECGAHSHSHCQLDVVSRDVARQEILYSKQQLEQQLGQAVYSFAYPFGYYSCAVKQLVRSAGFTSACAVKHAMSTSASEPFALARLMVKADYSLNTFASLLEGRLPALVEALYVRSRTPLYQLARRGAAMFFRNSQGGSYKEQGERHD